MAKKTEEKIKIKLVKSVICAPEKHEKIVKAFGLTKTYRLVENSTSATIMGMETQTPNLDVIVQ